MKYIYSESETFDCIIDKGALYRMLDLNKSLFPYPECNQYIDNWKKALVKTYMSEINSKAILIGKNFFCESVFIDISEMRFHFDIDKAITLCHYREKQIIPLEQISDIFINASQHKIKYTPTNDVDDIFDYSKCDIPVILITFANGGFSHLVIDGNHRIESRKKQNIDFVDAVYLTMEETTSILQSKFEQAVYQFLYEGFLVAKGNYSIWTHSISHLYL